MIPRFAPLLLGTLAVLAAPAVADELWQADFDVAAKLAREQGKDLFVDFTGSDWCGWCIRLHQEVFDHEEFQSAALRDFVLVSLDFPHGEEAKAAVPNPERNDELAKEHGIEGFPTILLMTADGEVYAETGYQPGGAEAYVKHLAEIRAAGRAALEPTRKIVAEFDGAEGEAKVALCEKAVEVLATLDERSPFIARLKGPARWALTCDPENEKGLKGRAVKALVRCGQLDEELSAAARELDPKNAEGMLDYVVQSQFSSVRDDDTARAALKALDELNGLGFKDSSIAFLLNFTAATWCDGPLEDPGGVLKYARIAKGIGSDDEQMMAHLDQLLGE